VNFMAPLLSLQEIDGRIRELQQEIRDIPTRKGMEKGRLSDTTERLESAKAKYQGMQAKIADLDTSIALQNERIRKFRQQQLSLRTNEEFRAMGQQIQSAEKEVERLELEQLTLQEGLDPMKEDMESIRAKLAEELEGVDATLNELEERMVQAEEMLGKLKKERIEAEKAVSKQFLQYYIRVKKSRWPVAVPLQDGSVCGGCHLVQPPSSLRMLEHNTVPVTCQMCGRMLYLDS
jgi:predicted  nucleic acid-binding Zn-ribbon protein